MKDLEFHFVDDEGREQENLSFATQMVAYFNCLNPRCDYGGLLCLGKPYKPVPLHYHSLLRICKPVSCPKCRTVHEHVENDDGMDAVRVKVSKEISKNQLSLF